MSIVSFDSSFYVWLTVSQEILFSITEESDNNGEDTFSRNLVELVKLLTTEATPAAEKLTVASLLML